MGMSHYAISMGMSHYTISMGMSHWLHNINGYEPKVAALLVSGCSAGVHLLGYVRGQFNSFVAHLQHLTQSFLQTHPALVSVARLAISCQPPRASVRPYQGGRLRAVQGLAAAAVRQSLQMQHATPAPIHRVKAEWPVPPSILKPATLWRESITCCLALTACINSATPAQLIPSSAPNGLILQLRACDKVVLAVHLAPAGLDWHGNCTTLGLGSELATAQHSG